MLDEITPVLLTYNEESNVARTLSRLGWAKDVVVVDSGSTDATVSIVTTFPNVRLFTRPFDTHARQWSFAVEQTNINTPWILRLDADYQVSDELIEEMRRLDPNAPISAYRIGFDYAIMARRLRSSLYPPNTVLLRKGKFVVSDKGHTEEWNIEGPISRLNGRIVHDDWKPVAHWVNSQLSYMQRELNWLHKDRIGFVHWLRRRPPLMPIAVFLYCLFGKGLILNGQRGIFYGLQRMVAEAILSLLILEERFRNEGDHAGSTVDDFIRDRQRN